jgi:ABC-2 type transport system ATP-binding protein
MKNALTIQNLTKTYKNGVQALKGVSFNVAEGDMFALLGPNGAGKTTTIGIMTSLVMKTSGHVSVFNYDIDKDITGAKTLLGLVPQEFNCGIFDKVIHVLITQAGYYGVPWKIASLRAEEYLNKLGLWDKRNHQVKELSGGMKRRLMIARALIHQPKLLILDEPTAGVDIELRRSMWEFIREINAKGTTIILTTHYLEEAENLCNNIAIIDRGILVENSDMRSLLAKLHTETFVLYLNSALTTAPVLGAYPCNLVDPLTLEVAVSKGQSMNELFALLSLQGITIASMRNKSNRLEELFLKLTGNTPEVTA